MDPAAPMNRAGGGIGNSSSSSSNTRMRRMGDDDSDARYAATLNEEEELWLALKISAYECHNRRGPTPHRYPPTVAAATVPDATLYLHKMI
jgi:hypothetical protein